jgi:CDP-diglyceride synthetase
MRGLFIALVSIVLAVAGWWGLYQLTGSLAPEKPGAPALFFGLLFVALTGTLAPVIAYMNRRFAPSVYELHPWRALRHGIWAGLCLTSWAWLQTQHELNPAFSLIIALIFVAIEFLIVKTRNA